MFLIYRPADGDEQRWTYKPQKLPSREAEAIEKRTGWTYGEFGEQLVKGSTLARRALLWTFLRRQHHTLRFDDLDFAVGEVEVAMDRAELSALREKMEDFDWESPAMRQMALDQVDEQIAEAEDDPDGPKAPASSGD